MQLTAAQLGASSFRGTQIQTASRRPAAQSRCPLNIQATKGIAGTVISVQMSKTAVIQVDRYIPHKLYGKRVRKTRKFFAHDEEESCTVGDTVRIVSIPPLSKRKCYKVDAILSKAV